MVSHGRRGLPPDVWNAKSARAKRRHKTKTAPGAAEKLQNKPKRPTIAPLPTSEWGKMSRSARRRYTQRTQIVNVPARAPLPERLTVLTTRATIAEANLKKLREVKANEQRAREVAQQVLAEAHARKAAAEAAAAAAAAGNHRKKRRRRGKNKAPVPALPAAAGAAAPARADPPPDPEVLEAEAVLAKCRAERNAASAAVVLFRTRVAAEGLDKLTVPEVCDLLSIIGTPMGLASLEEHDLTGPGLRDLTEADFEAVFGLPSLGKRRKLHLNLRRLANKQGFDAPPKHPWDVEKVCKWLAEEGFAPHMTRFRTQDIDGDILFTLTRDDLTTIGIKSLKVKSSLIRKIAALKKHQLSEQALAPSDAGPAPTSDGAAAAASASDGSSRTSSMPQLDAKEQRLVLEHVLSVNAELAKKVEEGRGVKRSREPPKTYLCPITTELMVDPVVAGDGFTYERAAIQAWFQRNDTSPMTREIVPPHLLPNKTLKSAITDWMEQGGET